MTDELELLLTAFGILTNTGFLAGIFLRLGKLSEATKNNSAAIQALWIAVNELRAKINGGQKNVNL